MFTQSNKVGSSPDAAETFIGPSVKLEGNFDADGDIVVEGLLTGNLTTRGDVRVGSQSVIDAKIDAKNAVIAGRIKGNITILNSLTLRSTASILGDIKTMSLTVEDGATINGKITMKRDRNGKNSEPTLIDEKIEKESLE